MELETLPDHPSPKALLNIFQLQNIYFWRCLTWKDRIRLNMRHLEQGASLQGTIPTQAIRDRLEGDAYLPDEYLPAE